MPKGCYKIGWGTHVIWIPMTCSNRWLSHARDLDPDLIALCCLDSLEASESALAWVCWDLGSMTIWCGRAWPRKFLVHITARQVEIEEWLLGSEIARICQKYFVILYIYHPSNPSRIFQKRRQLHTSWQEHKPFKHLPQSWAANANVLSVFKRLLVKGYKGSI